MAVSDPPSEAYSHYVAIDFGTAGSSIAFATSTSEKIHLYSDWQKAKATKKTGVDIKVPTILLLDPDKNLELIGNDALHVYQTKNVKNKQKLGDYYLFDRFKMSLHKEDPKMNLYTSFTVKAKNGKELPAVEVISKLLTYFKDEFFTEYTSLQQNPSMKLPSISRIMWIITVPAIWSLAAKQIMKSAAVMAGLASDTRRDSLIFALEPEAAAIHCEKEFSLIPQAPGIGSEKSYYLIADCGGGTVDIAVHKLTKYPNGEIKIKELACVHGGPLGGFAVNDKFEAAFLKMCQLSEEDADDIKQKYPSDWTTLMNNFENSKTTSTDKTDRTIGVPKRIYTFVEEKSSRSMEDLAESYDDTHEFIWDPDEGDLIIPYPTLRTLFTSVIGGICEKIGETLQRSPKRSKIQNIILVGGFATCELLSTTVETHFPPPMRVIKGPDPWLSVLQGVKTSQPFDKEIHKESNKEVHNGQEYCKDVFYPLIVVNEDVRAGHIATHTFRPASETQDYCDVLFYATKEEFVMYIDDPRLYELGKCTIKNLPKENSGECREIKLTVDFSKTDGIDVLATSVNMQKNFQLSLNFSKSDDLYLS
ncbi:heat shock 70 kDa protein 12B-like isoform X2 [Dysidea avara]|uniref:heat shock 70 kDa protein 12B-like isoform X2 n=1 Tax=Dysidea avara TaxID=196820 RepID=UPI0033191F22